MSERKYIRFGIYKPEEVLPFFTGVDDGTIKDYDLRSYLYANVK